MDQLKVGSFLRSLRTGKKLTQEQLAEKIGVTQRTVSRWETGKNLPDLDILIELSDLYEVDIRELLNGERKTEKANENVKETVQQVAAYNSARALLLKKKVYYAIPFLLSVFIVVLFTLLGSVIKTVCPILIVVAAYSMIMGLHSPTKLKCDYIISLIMPFSMSIAMFFGGLFDPVYLEENSISFSHALRVSSQPWALYLYCFMALLTLVMSIRTIRIKVRRKKNM